MKFEIFCEQKSMIDIRGSKMTKKTHIIFFMKNDIQVKLLLEINGWYVHKKNERNEWNKYTYMCILTKYTY